LSLAVYILDVRLLREFIESVLLETQSTFLRKLRVFDFDDTLVKTKSLIHVTTASGEMFDLTPGEYAVYEPAQGDQFDYSDFSRLIDPEEIVWTGQVLRRIIAKGGEVVILTARAHRGPVQQFLEEAGLPPLEVIALANADPLKKSEYIEGRLASGEIDFVEFFDDSYKNVEAVRALGPKYPGVKIVARHVKHVTRIS
jgi:phosphoglycolate phosphatase-like HAD superfamily hydrolase